MLSTYWLGKYPVTLYNINMPISKEVNKDFFKKWTPEMAYVLGFFAADGYMTVNKRGGQFWCMDIKDKIIIEKIKKEICSNHKISVRKRRDKYINYRIQIGSVEICNDLRILGFYENKTKNLSVPNVPKDNFNDFVRGYFDGDGNVWSGFMHKGRNVWSLSIQVSFTSCSKIFLDGMKTRLEEFGIEKGVLRKGAGDYYRLTYSVSNSLKLYNFMYNGLCGSKLYLNRKKKVFEKYTRMKC